MAKEYQERLDMQMRNPAGNKRPKVFAVLLSGSDCIGIFSIKSGFGMRVNGDMGVLLEGPMVSPARAAEDKSQATTVPTFHCLSLYWSPERGGAGKQVIVKCRPSGPAEWRDGLAMRYNPIDTPECKGDYRGSVVNF